MVSFGLGNDARRHRVGGRSLRRNKVPQKMPQNYAISFICDYLKMSEKICKNSSLAGDTYLKLYVTI